ncbi:septum site-determining protein MinC [Caloranaerobacter azorensis DSM 13643]|uniref:Probable septum site-determining protein MinC n=1 Tax=Caloranaerobacter azorensis DSM 13643 TaxID=1121264 RepID=A0A1M5UD20_9FIRM|nr:septum site-determining protein MinC [Caloranaerobacter azorensis]SHH60811.1 septum site-determining protein MinC [Caloranaerobacter azorensis DSM 13643]
MEENLVIFKGKKEGIYIYIKEGNFQNIKRQLEEKLEKAKGFFQGGKVRCIKGKRLSPEEKRELIILIQNKYGISVDEKHELEEKNNQISETNLNTESFFEGIREGKTKFIRATIRSGQYVEYDGNLVILGDVNAGAEVKAKGNIIILGVLRGIAHAGYDGNKDAIVAAFSLQPTQLRIAEVIARSPDDEKDKPKWPEVASIKDGKMLIEPYLTKK